MIACPLAVLAAVVVYVIQPDSYRASALLRLSARETSLVFSGTEVSDFDIFQGTQKELVTTRLVMIAALRNMTDSSVLQMERPVDWMLDNVDVSTPDQTEVMTVSTVAAKEANPVEIVNATVDAYMVEVVNRERDTRQRKLVGIEKVFDDKQTEIRLKRNELKQLAEQLGSGDSETLSVRQQLLVQELGYVRRQRIELQSERTAIEAETESIKAVLQAVNSKVEGQPILPSDVDIDAAIASDAIYRELIRDKVTTFRIQAGVDASLKQDSPSPYPKVQSQIDAAMEQRRTQIREELEAFAPLRQKSRDQQQRFEAERRLQQLSAEAEVFQKLDQRLESDESRLMGEFKQVGNQSIDVEMMRSEISQLDAVLASIGQQREELKVELQSRPRVEVLRKADEIEPANFVKRIGFAGAAGSLAFAGPFALIVILDLLRRKVNSSDDLVNRVGIDVLGTIPQIPRSMIRSLHDPKSSRSRHWQMKLGESVKRLSSRLLTESAIADSRSGGKVILVTSAVRSEGKTTLATQLAMSLANRSRSVILCDFDLRRPQLNKLLGVSQKPGVAEVLRGDIDLIDAMKQTFATGLSVVPAGECCPLAINALAEEGAEALIQQLRLQADLIIIDGCPVLTSADISFLSPHADQIIFAVRRDVSRTPNLLKAANLIPAHDHQIAGAVVIEKCSDSLDSQLVGVRQ